MAKKRQKTIPVPSPSPLPSLPSPATPAEPSVDKDDEGEDENIKDPVEVEDEDISLPLPPPLARFISVWKAIASGKRESLPSTKSAIFNTKNIYYFELDEWQNQIILLLLPRKFKIIRL